MRITKYDAENISREMTKKQMKEIEKSRRQLSELITELYLDKIPEKVRRMFNDKEASAYFYKTGSATPIGVGLDHEPFTLSKSCPCAGQGYYDARFPVDDIAAKNITTSSYTIKDMEKSRDALRRDIEAALLNLKTYKRIEEDFKEAAKYLPNRVSSAVAINIDTIRERLKTA